MKFCSKCGTQLPDEAVFCTKCGATTGDAQAYTPSYTPPPVSAVPEIPPVPQKPKKRIHPLAIILPAVFLLLIAAGAIIYFTLFNSPPAAFVKANEMFVSNISSIGSDELSQRVKNENFEASFSLAFKDITGADDATKQAIANMSVVYDILKAKNEGGINISANMGTAGLFKMTGLLTSDKVIAGLSSNGKVQSASYMNLPGDASTPVLERLFNLVSNTKPDKRLDKLLDKAKNAALQSIDSAWFTSKAGSYTNLTDNSNVNATEVTMTLDGKTVKKFVAAFAEKLDKDPDFYKDLQAYLSANVKDAPSDAAAELKKSLNELQSQIPNNGFTITWTAYQTNGKTVAIHINADIDTVGKIALKLQKYEQDKTQTITFAFDVLPKEGDPVNVTQHTVYTKKDDSTIDFTFDTTSKAAGETVSSTGKGDITLTKKNANEYSQKINLDMNTEVPDAATGKTTPMNIKFAIDGSYLFGNVSLKNSKFFNADELEKTAKEADSVETFFSSVFSGLSGNGSASPLDFSKLVPGLSEDGTEAQPESSAEPTESAVPSPDPSASQSASAGFNSVFTTFDSTNWYFYDYVNNKQDNSYAKIDNNSVILPRSDNSKRPSLVSQPVSFKKGDTLQIYRTIQFENQKDYIGDLFIMYGAEGTDLSSAKEALATEYNFGPATASTKSNTFVFYQKDPSGNYKSLAEMPAANKTQLLESIVVNTGTGDCYWTIGQTVKTINIGPMDDGYVYMVMQSFGSDDASILRVYNAGILQYKS